MIDNPNVLVIVEGEKLEPRIFRIMQRIYGFRCNIEPFRTNIHVLYQKIKQNGDEGEFVDVISVLREMCRDKIENCKSQRAADSARSDFEKLKSKFSSIYLVFDSELQHMGTGGALSKADISRNYNELREMLEFFNNDTENGKLYINYPMMEACFDADDFFDESYSGNKMDVFVTKSYKNKVYSRKLRRMFRESITKQQMDSIICMNAFKSELVVDGKWSKPCFDVLVDLNYQQKILERQITSVDCDNSIWVLNTSLFFVIDYFGRKYYDALPGSDESVLTDAKT